MISSLRRYYQAKLVYPDVCSVLRVETYLFDSGISYHTAEGIVRSSINFKTYRADGSLRDDDAFWDIFWNFQLGTLPNRVSIFELFTKIHRYFKIFDKICCWKVKYEKSVNLIFIFYHFLVIVFTFKNRCSHILISYFTFSKIGKNQINIDSKIILFFNCIYLFLFFECLFCTYFCNFHKIHEFYTTKLCTMIIYKSLACREFRMRMLVRIYDSIE